MTKLEMYPRAQPGLWLLLFCFGVMAVSVAAAEPATRWWSEPVEQALGQSGTNRQELVKALGQVPNAQREGLQFLVENMPEPDLKLLSAEFLLTHVALIYNAFEQAPGHTQVPKEIFLNDVLPYICISETRDAWGKVLREKCA